MYPTRNKGVGLPPYPKRSAAEKAQAERELVENEKDDASAQAERELVENDKDDASAPD